MFCRVYKLRSYFIRHYCNRVNPWKSDDFVGNVEVEFKSGYI